MLRRRALLPGPSRGEWDLGTGCIPVVASGACRAVAISLGTGAMTQQKWLSMFWKNLSEAELLRGTDTVAFLADAFLVTF